MDKIALISDIHGNLPALEAVLQDIGKRKITRIFCLGDLVGKGPYPGKAIDICCARCERVIMGNWEEVVCGNYKHEIIQWQRQRLSEEHLEYIGGLPGCIEFSLSGKKFRLFHASHKGNLHRVQRNASDEQQLGMFTNTEFTGDSFQPDIIGYADIHIVFLKHFRDKILFNIGSVGNPLDYPQASYVVLEGEYCSSHAGVYSIDIVRVPYDIELAIGQAEQEKLPDLERYTAELRTGEYGGDPALHQ